MNFTNLGLDREQESLLMKSGHWLAEQGYYLAGGAALAIYFGHRRSVDLDWFSAATIPDALVLAQRLRAAGLPFETGQTAPGTLHGQIGGVRLSFYDTHILLSRHRSLAELLRLYQHKFSVSDITPMLYGLAYFDDAENEPEPTMLVKISWKQVKKDILRWLRDFSR